MKKTSRILFMISFVIIFSAASVAQLSSQDINEDELAIQKLFFDMSDALMDKEWERYQSFWVQDTTLNVVHPGDRDWATGWHAVELRYRPLFSPEVNFQAELKTDEFKVYVAPGGEFAWAVVDLKAIMGEYTLQSWQVMVLRKIDGRWRVNLAFAANLPPAKGK